MPPGGPPVPEIPDLENIIAFLNGKIPGVRIDSVEPRIPIVIRFPTADRACQEACRADLVRRQP